MRKGKEPDPDPYLTYGSGRPKNMRIRIPNPACTTFFGKAMLVLERREVESLPQV
jgi:hypothetical protein